MSKNILEDPPKNISEILLINKNHSEEIMVLNEDEELPTKTFETTAKITNDEIAVLYKHWNIPCKYLEIKHNLLNAVWFPYCLNKVSLV